MKLFLDTNIPKFSVLARPIWQPRPVAVNWGEETITLNVHSAGYDYPLERVRNETLRKDALAILFLSEASRRGFVKLVTSSESMLERWGIPKQDSITGLMYGEEIELVPAPIVYGRVVMAPGASLNDLQHRFLSGINDKRFQQICRMTGAYQGVGKPLNHSQAVDAFLLWCAEASDADYFVTMDYKLIRMLKRHNEAFRVPLVTPTEFLHDLLMKHPLRAASVLTFGTLRAFRIGKRLRNKKGLSHRDHFA